MAEVMRMGLTGGIGSGKSTAARMLSELGAAIIDADAISRGVTAPGGLAIPAITAQFGADFINAHGALDRDKMRGLAYAQPASRKRLEAIVHPLVGHEIARQADAALAAGKHWLVFDIPLLVESSHWRQKLDQVLVMDCTPEVQISRVMQRSGLDRVAIEKIIASQASRQTRLQGADLVVCNDRLSLDELKQALGQIARQFGLSSL